jgi:hypothetical protein
MAPNEGYPQSGAGPEDLRRQRQAETVERLSSLVSDYGLDPGIAAEYSSDTTTIYVYPGMEPALGDRLDELKAKSKHSGPPAGVLGNGGFVLAEVTFSLRQRGLRPGCAARRDDGCRDRA